MKTVLTIIILMCGSTAMAQNYCGTSRIVYPQQNIVYQQSYVQPVYKQQFNVIEKVDVIQKKVEFDAEYFVGYDGYYSVGQELKEQEISQSNDLLLKQSEQVNRLLKLLEQTLANNIISEAQPSQPVQPYVPPIQPVPQQPEEVPDITPPDDSQSYQSAPPQDQKVSTEVVSSDLNNRVYQIFAQSCASCHGQTSPKAGLQLIGEDKDGRWLEDLKLEDRVLVYDHTADINLRERGKKLMPLGGSALPQDEIETLRLWMIAKAEEIKRGN